MFSTDTRTPVGASSQQPSMAESQNGRRGGHSSDKSLSGIKVAPQDEEHVHAPEIKTN